MGRGSSVNLRKLFKQEAEKLGATVTDANDLAVGVFFLPNNNQGLGRKKSLP